MNLFLESCCTSVSDVLQAQSIGARRIELCSQLEVGGVTPSAELLDAVLAVASIPVNVLVRPRGGDFVYSSEEASEIVTGIEMCRARSVNGVVIGALTPDGDVDMSLMKCFLSYVGPLSVTFHRAFDVCRDPLTAYSDICELGCDRLLTSGHEDNSVSGADLIARLVALHGRTSILVGGGVRRSNIDFLASRTGAPEFHASILNFNK